MKLTPGFIKAIKLMNFLLEVKYVYMVAKQPKTFFKEEVKAELCLRKEFELMSKLFSNNIIILDLVKTRTKTMEIENL